MDIPAPLGTPVYAIDDGVVRIAGVHTSYSDPVVQVCELMEIHCSYNSHGPGVLHGS